MDPEPFKLNLSLWRHPVTMGWYLVFGIATCSTNGREKERSVVYWSFKYKGLRYREVDEFYDGRFKEVEDYRS